MENLRGYNRDTILLTKDLEENLTLISLNVPTNFNFKTRKLMLKGDIKCIILYISGLSKKEDIEDRIINPLLFNIACDISALSLPVSYISERYITISDTQVSSDINLISEALKNGETIILIENENTSIIRNTSTSNFKKIANSKIEETIRGEKSAFVELLPTNIGLIQEKLKNNNLRIENYVFGEENNCEAVLIYMENVIDTAVLNKLKSKLENIKTSHLSDTGYLTQLI